MAFNDNPFGGGASALTGALVALGATTPATDTYPYFNSSSTATTGTFNAYSRGFLQNATSVAAAQTYLGVADVLCVVILQALHVN